MNIGQFDGTGSSCEVQIGGRHFTVDEKSDVIWYLGVALTR